MLYIFDMNKLIQVTLILQIRIFNITFKMYTVMNLI